MKAASGYSGTVTETMDSGGYTYVCIDTGKEKIWAAAPKLSVKTGDVAHIPPGSLMTNYHSKTLNRTFDEIYFVPQIALPGADASPQQTVKTGAGAPQMGGGGMKSKPSAAPINMDFSGIKKPAGGKTVAEIFAEKAALSGKEVKLCGKVVKFSSEIMGKNWLHLQDGTGSQETNDLTITTSSTVQVGETVEVSGILTLDKDFGFGYKYNVIIEDANVLVK